VLKQVPIEWSRSVSQRKPSQQFSTLCSELLREAKGWWAGGWRAVAQWRGRTLRKLADAEVALLMTRELLEKENSSETQLGWKIDYRAPAAMSISWSRRSRLIENLKGK
jgi:hypothetical protein